MEDILALKDRFERNGTSLLKKILAPYGKKKFLNAIFYAMEDGKRIRPILVYIVNKILKIELDDSSALAIELVHNFTLTHDDLPLLDDDKSRRDKPTLHIVFGGGTALLAGDMMQALAFNLVNGRKSAILAKYASEVSFGQAIELSGESSFEEIVSKKTSSLFKASLLLGTNENTDKKTLIILESLGELLGLAFQIQDDKFDGEATRGESEKLFQQALVLASQIDNEDRLLGKFIDFLQHRTY